jgi:hypothetical protein
MTNVSYERRKTDSAGNFAFEYRKTTSGNSSRVNGKLVLRSNTLDHRKSSSHRILLGTCPAVTPIDSSINGVLSQSDIDILNRLANVALQRFTAKVKKHNASLGVTLASWRQARDMITSRTHTIADHMTSIQKSVSKMTARSQRRLGKRDRASDFLEGEFGWRPLITDIQNAFDTLGRERPDSEWNSSSARAFNEITQASDYPASGYRYQNVFTSTLRVNVGARVKVVNQNLWLANQLGLLNLPGVAWDLIPWSFVVNMFTNIGHMVNSITDFVGLELDNVATTRSAWIERTFDNFPSTKPSAPKYTGHSWGNLRTVSKTRSVGGSIPTPNFMWKCPELNLELAGIAMALVVQKMGRINSVIKPRLI